MKRIDTVARFYGRRIASLLPLRNGVSLDTVLVRVYSAMERFWLEFQKNESLHENIKWIDEHTLLLIPRHHKSKGRPRRAAMSVFIPALVSIYEDATGVHIRRVNVIVPDDSSEGQHEEEKLDPFLAFCIEAASFGKIKQDDMSYPRVTVKKALKQLHPNAKLGRPTNSPIGSGS